MNRTTLRPLAMLISALLMAGCTQTTYRGHGEYFELAHRNVVERDLSSSPTLQPVFNMTYQAPIKPPPVITAPKKQASTTPSLVEMAIKQQADKKLSPQPKKPTVKRVTPPPPPKVRFSLYEGERYQDAIVRWFNKAGYSQIAWGVDDETLDVLGQPAEKNTAFRTDLRGTMTTLSKTLGKTLNVTLSPKSKLAAIHPWSRDVSLVSVEGRTLQAALKTLTADYGWKWQPDSWQINGDFSFSESYPLVTPKGDIGMALSRVIEDYPVNANLLDATRTVFVVEE